MLTRDELIDKLQIENIKLKEALEKSTELLKGVCPECPLTKKNEELLK